MSDSSPLLLNMGAEVATAAGIQTTPTGTSPASGNGNEFAGVLQAVMAPTVKPDAINPLVAKQFEINPLLFSQLDGSAEQLLKQDDILLEDLAGGKQLPDEEQQLAWQTMLAEYDSDNPETARIVVAQGDDQGYQVEEFTPEDILKGEQLHEPIKPENTQTGIYGKDIQPKDIQPKDIHSKDIHPKDVHTKDIQSTAGTEINQAAEKSAIPVISTNQSELQNTLRQNQVDQTVVDAESQAKIESLQNVMTDKGQNSNQHKQQLNQIATQMDKSLPVAGEKDPLSTQSQLDVVKQSNFQTELNSSLDNQAAKQMNSSTANTTSQPGASAYASVLGLGSTSIATPSSVPVVANLTVPPQSPAWGEIVGDRVQWMAGQNIQEAKIRLNPPELGLLEVRIQVGNDQQTSISFSSPHSQVRDALETAVPRLREMFTDSGLTLGDVNVSHHSMAGHGQKGQEGQEDHQAGSSANDPLHGSNEVTEIAPTQPLVNHGSGMLDLYA